MYWDEDDKQAQDYVVPDDIVDLAFAVSCRCLPPDHAHALSSALCEALPWLTHEPGAGVHLIHGAESGNGWYRPEDPERDVLYLSRRTRMTLRLPKARVADARALGGSELDVAGYALRIGEATVRPLSTLPTLFARYVVADTAQGEEDFLEDSAARLRETGIPVRKLLCGRSHSLRTPEGAIFTRSLMVADLDAEQSVRLQQCGLGRRRMMGCGLFIPHKGIAPVRRGEDG
ncbi:MAG TPA: type I-MYXAN CRISPR-associated protein Cas6/Cmx6 [Gammaproteobacteria bacterium]|nr:CRISPR-associated endonuclease Cas6 [bacterium BMS3Abin12]HDK03577.1 type I-MYXAN CRISPR-associated protein Cas6/Cmx6 [Gammaproteobacteria bacterium]